uniref:Uncharacterized protein n=1 Tax=Chromera velia CCMP2878 TaxID=1169474 RepID=A0A0G4H126_9ALVE|eukprot:Cvel_5523.t1-p1 / transcript=Cvel_5523.t1 / gene=Cvel_5523 / organism=Chromera_velia_CCMP2878 / gene_product=hypothetical protein / transcript_product=hypothetical protein / location=Cvel_scaffold258:104718-108314(-) / protein_length=690 / sequence_SO=supercontig / SO=protein_coding / is_pseudo=false
MLPFLVWALFPGFLILSLRVSGDGSSVVCASPSPSPRLRALRVRNPSAPLVCFARSSAGLDIVCAPRGSVRELSLRALRAVLESSLLVVARPSESTDRLLTLRQQNPLQTQTARRGESFLFVTEDCKTFLPGGQTQTQTEMGARGTAAEVGEVKTATNILQVARMKVERGERICFLCGEGGSVGADWDLPCLRRFLLRLQKEVGGPTRTSILPTASDMGCFVSSAFPLSKEFSLFRLSLSPSDSTSECSRYQTATEGGEGICNHTTADTEMKGPLPDVESDSGLTDQLEGGEMEGKSHDYCAEEVEVADENRNGVLRQKRERERGDGLATSVSDETADEIRRDLQAGRSVFLSLLVPLSAIPSSSRKKKDDGRGKTNKSKKKASKEKTALGKVGGAGEEERRENEEENQEEERLQLNQWKRAVEMLLHVFGIAAEVESPTGPAAGRKAGGLLSVKGGSKGGKKSSAGHLDAALCLCVQEQQVRDPGEKGKGRMSKVEFRGTLESAAAWLRSVRSPFQFCCGNGQGAAQPMELRDRTESDEWKNFEASPRSEGGGRCASVRASREASVLVQLGLMPLPSPSGFSSSFSAGDGGIRGSREAAENEREDAASGTVGNLGKEIGEGEKEGGDSHGGLRELVLREAESEMEMCTGSNGKPLKMREVSRRVAGRLGLKSKEVFRLLLEANSENASP